MTKLIFSLSLAALTFAAHARAAAEPAWVCGMEFNGRSHGVQFIIGQFKTEAEGQLRCVGIDGQQYANENSNQYEHAHGDSHAHARPTR